MLEIINLHVYKKESFNQKILIGYIWLADDFWKKIKASDTCIGNLAEFVQNVPELPIIFVFLTF